VLLDEFDVLYHAHMVFGVETLIEGFQSAFEYLKFAHYLHLNFKLIALSKANAIFSIPFSICFSLVEPSSAIVIILELGNYGLNRP